MVPVPLPAQSRERWDAVVSYIQVYPHILRDSNSQNRADPVGSRPGGLLGRSKPHLGSLINPDKSLGQDINTDQATLQSHNNQEAAPQLPWPQAMCGKGGAYTKA